MGHHLCRRPGIENQSACFCTIWGHNMSGKTIAFQRWFAAEEALHKANVLFSKPCYDEN